MRHLTLEVIEQCAAHVAEQHGLHSFPPKLWVRVRRSVRTVQA